MPDLRGLMADPQFKALPIERQKAILARVNPQLAEEYAASRQGKPAETKPELSNMEVLKNSVTALGKSAYNAVAGVNNFLAGPDMQGGPIGGPPKMSSLPVKPEEQTQYAVGNAAQFMLPGGPVRGVAGMLAQGGKAAAVAGAQGGDPVTAGAFGAAGPLTAKVAEMVAPALQKFARVQYERALHPTTKRLKATTERIVPGLLKERAYGSLESLAQQGAKEAAPAGKALGEAYAEATKAGKTVATAPIMKRLAKLKERYYVKNSAGESFAANPGAVARIEAVEELVGKFGSHAPPDQLWLLRQNIDDIITGTGGFTNDIKRGTAKHLQTATRTAIQKELNKINPDLEKLNATFSLWTGLREVASATIERTRGQRGIVEGGIRATLGAGLGALIGDNDTVWGPVGGILGLATKDPRWRTFSAVQKARLADALVSGDAAAASSILSRALASWSGGANAPPARPDPGRP